MRIGASAPVLFSKLKISILSLYFPYAGDDNR